MRIIDQARDGLQGLDMALFGAPVGLVGVLGESRVGIAVPIDAVGYLEGLGRVALDREQVVRAMGAHNRIGGVAGGM